LILKHKEVESLFTKSQKLTLGLKNLHKKGKSQANPFKGSEMSLFKGNAEPY